MKPITTEASDKQTEKQTFVNGRILKKNLPSAIFFKLPPINKNIY